MKKLIYISILVSLCTMSQAQEIKRIQLRTMYMQAIHGRPALDSLIAMLEKVQSPSPAEQSYLGICEAVLIQYTDGNWSKYRLLNKAKCLLNKAIERAPNDPEFRFMRFTLEHYLPSFLCMSIHLKDDLDVIVRQAAFLDENPDLKKMALEFILASNRCDNGQRVCIERGLSQINRKLLTASKN